MFCVIIHIVILSYKYRINPKDNQVKKLDEMLWCFCGLYNGALEERIGAYTKAGETLTYQSQAASLKDIRANDDQYKQFSHTAKQKVLRRLDKAYKAFFQRVKKGIAAGFPRFKASSRYNTAEFTFGDGIRLKGNRIRIVGIPGGIQVNWHRDIPEGAKIKSATVTRRNGKWFACFQVEVNDVIKSIPENIVGIDMGIAAYVSDSDGCQVELPKFYQNREKELRRKNRALARKKRYSIGWKEAKRQLNNLHGSIVGERDIFIHKVANEYVNKYDGIVVENLNVKGMVKSNLSKSISNAAWSKLVTYLEFKAEKAGISVEKVNPAYTSQQCSHCGHTDKLNRQTQAEFKCVACDFSANADHNASINILEKSKLWAETVQRSLTYPVAECVGLKAACL